ncbi:URC4/urg3 family protein [Leptolyngbya sp. FACHB-261]|uniref:URC4/urg3 family protein n=1 Tax=Leptolyngbya sp. FACHB-261 TaxID=2692806 RepID=UPI0016895B36|nr:URC4/urg3 family protein [Leptolyngbya sp. FACHB-261]MBD2103021.1 URC4/urg3 family protein [Leptolyngbya sp. FACHB-261]
MTTELRDDQARAIAYLQSPSAIRERCGQLFALACNDQLEHFVCDLSQLDQVADYVLQVMRAQYPDLQIPFHSRWRHFDAGHVPRLAQLDDWFNSLSVVERARAKFDLVITSVLLDAGSGPQWQYQEASTGQVYRRSEGLAVASFHLFCQGTFSAQPEQPWRADARELQTLTEADLAQGLQVGAGNPLVGVDGRQQLLQRLGQAVEMNPQLFAEPRPGALFDYLLTQSQAGQLEASTVLQAVLEGFGPIWPGRASLAGVNLGDVWPHPALATSTTAQGQESDGGDLVPFHKLSQWLTYSLLEPLQDAGLTVTGLDALTGLAEYRNGGLCLDLGLLRAKQASVTETSHLPGSTVIVEWRALTISLLDAIAESIRKQLGLTATELPLAKVLEGGTWSAGRKIAAERRAGGEPPIRLQSDGTVF